MRARFLHLADCHLGYRQYGRNERFNDFSKAFYAVMDAAVSEKVDFVVLAGDLFQKRSIDALTLNHAMRGLERLQKAGIPCLAVEGNHELAYFNESIGWMRFLAERELLILLDTPFEDGKPILQAYTRKRGAYIDIKPGLRVYGLRYYGSSTASAVAHIGAALSEEDRSGVEYTLFIAHTGIEGVLAGEAGGLTHRELAPLHSHVNYLALGHVHKPFDFDGWIYNPGSPETCSMTEAAWPERGYYLVDVDTSAPSPGTGEGRGGGSAPSPDSGEGRGGGSAPSPDSGEGRGGGSAPSPDSGEGR
ncbi:MAG: exonuclease SbcCD subunit D, partial [Caldilineaceae bacterium]|nr:exonuclease SbcCD subunit D [Caldilineaceae bacterium]